MADQLEQKCEDASAYYEELKAAGDGELISLLCIELDGGEEVGIELYKLQYQTSLLAADRERIIDFLTEENKF